MAPLKRTFACLGGILMAAALSLPIVAQAEILDDDKILGKTDAEAAHATEDRPDLGARAAILVRDDGTAYFERRADEELKIASITKVMTAILTLENTAPTDEVVVDQRAATVGQSSADLKEGDVLTVEEALRALMIPSGNDAAMALATHVGAILDPGSSDPYGAFIDAMNAKAAELGMDHTVFANPHGLDFEGWEGDFHSTARDVATMFAHAMKNDDFRALTSNPDNIIVVTDKDGNERSIEMIERNEILGQHGNIGGKTGGTYIALQCFVGAFKRDDGGEVYTVTLGSDDSDQRWADTIALADWYYNHVVEYPLGDPDHRCPDGRVLIAQVPHADWTDKTVDVTLEDPFRTAELFSLAGDVEFKLELDKMRGDITHGDPAGTIRLMQDGKEIMSEPLVCAEDQAAPSGIEWLMVQFDRLVRLVTGQPRTAQEIQYTQAPDPLELDAVPSPEAA